MFKKGLAILLALSVLLCLAACGESPAPAEATTPTPSPSAVPTEESVTPTPEPTAVPETSLAYHSTDAIRERGTLRVALQTENSKMSYFVPEGLEEFADRAGEPSGYVPWVCQQMAEDLGVALEFVFYDTAEQQLMSAQNGEVDAAVFTTFDRAFADLLVEDIMGQLICQCEYEIVNPEIKGVGFVLMKGNDELCDYLNERLTQYRSSGQLQEWNDLNETEAQAMGII